MSSQRNTSRGNDSRGVSASFPEGASPVTTSGVGLEEPSWRAMMVAPPTGDIDPIKLGLTRPSKVQGLEKVRVDANNVGAWKVPDDGLKCVPDFFVLERTARFIVGAKPSIVAIRISDCFRRRSIAATYDNEKVKAKCLSSDYVDFRVRLFAGSDEFRDGVIVEVQRRRGSCVSFHRDCRAILDAAENCQTSIQAPQVSKRPADIFDFEKLEDQATKQKRREEEAAKALEITIELLRKDRIDANVLGMESLCAMTNSSKTSSETALLTSKSIVCDVESDDVRRLIASLIKYGSLPSDVDDDENKEVDTLQQELKFYALNALSNALNVTSDDGCLSDAIRDQSWIVDELVPSLIKEVNKAKIYPHNAFWAAKSLNTLMKSSSQVRGKALEIGALEAFSMAKDFGTGCHANLADETENGVMTMECKC